MSFLPVADRELRRSARMKATYYWRSGAALLAASVGFAFITAGFGGALSPSSAGKSAFTFLAISATFFSAITSILLTCDCISHEKREGTLGLLFLTDLRGFDVVLGKLSRLTPLFYWLMAMLPAFGFSFILGGISLGDLVKTALSMGNIAFFFAALGLLISACCWHERRATGIAGACLVVIGGLMPVFGCVLYKKAVLSGSALLTFSPIGTLIATMADPSMKIAKSFFISSLLVTHLLGWVFLILAGFAIHRSIGRRETYRFPTRAKSANPFDDFIEPTLSIVERTSPMGGIVAFALFITLTGTVTFRTKDAHEKTAILAVSVLLLHGFLKFMTAARACRLFAQKRQSGELELLLTTPFPEEDLLRIHLIALKRQMLGPVLFAFGWDAVALFLACYNVEFWEGFWFAVVLFVEVIWLLGNLYSLAWLGSFLGIKHSSHGKALRLSLLYVVVIPWLLVLLAMAVIGIAKKGLPGDVAAVTAIVGLLIAVPCCSFGFASWAMGELRDRLRILAAHHIWPAEKKKFPARLKAFLLVLKEFLTPRLRRPAN